MQNKILRFVVSLLGDSHRTSGDNHSFYCPICNHRKRKLEVDVKKGWWHCWVCDKGSKNLFGLLKWIRASNEYYTELAKIVKHPSQFKSTSTSNTYDAHASLPDEFIPLWEVNERSFYWRAAINYLFSRGVSTSDIVKYGIGYCMDGRYQEMLIIPSYDAVGNLNYFATRAFMDNSELSFLNPKIHRDIIGFELMINWDQPIILVEGVFDAITVRYNAIPLFGKTILDVLKMAIIKNNVKQIYICLDADAIANATKHAEYFVGCGIDVYLVELPDGEDPSSIGYFQIWKYINEATRMNDTGLLELKIKDHLYGKGKTYLSRRRRSLSAFSSSYRV